MEAVVRGGAAAVFVDETEFGAKVLDPLDRAGASHQVVRRRQRGNAAAHDQWGLGAFHVGVALA